MKCWQVNKKNPANKIKDFDLNSMRDYESMPEVIGAISTVATIAKHSKTKRNQDKMDEKHEDE